MEYIYTQNPNAPKPIILVDKYIGTDAKGVTGIDGGQFAREVLALKNAGKTELEVWINSKGGGISDGFNMYGTLKNSGLKVTTVNMGAVDSTAGWIYQAGDHRVWMNYALGLVHEVQGADGAHKEAANISIATMLANGSKGKKTVEDCLKLMAANTVMNASVANEYGFYDELRNCNDILSFTNSSDINEIVQFGEKQTKKLLPKNNNMEALNSILGLSNEASEVARLEAVNKIINAKNVAEKSLSDKVQELTNINAELTKTKGDLLVAEGKIMEADKANKKMAAEKMVNEYVGTRIPKEDNIVSRWVNLAIGDMDGTKAMIEAIPLNIKAPNPLEDVENNSELQTASNIAVFMAMKDKENKEKFK